MIYFYGAGNGIFVSYIMHVLYFISYEVNIIPFIFLVYIFDAIYILNGLG